MFYLNFCRSGKGTEGIDAGTACAPNPGCVFVTTLL